MCFSQSSRQSRFLIETTALQLDKRSGRALLFFCHPDHSRFHSFEDLQISRAAAKIPRERFPNLIPRRMRIRIEQRFGRH